VSEAPARDVPPAVHQVLRAPGRPLDEGTRAFMETRFAHDFSGVQVHAVPQPQRALLASSIPAGQASDPAEREADRIAVRVMAQPDITPSGEEGSAPDQEPRTDLSQVRIHNDGQAQELSQRLGARAFAYGTDIYFNQGQYNPGSAEGRQLLAHELAHVIQQASGQPKIQRQQLAGCQDLLAEPTVASLISGTTVHNLIEADFAGRVAGATSIAIPGASAAPQRSEGICGRDSKMIKPQLLGGRAGTGFPDLARHTAGGILQVAEIKPAALPCLVDGETQLMRYIDQGNATDPPQTAWRSAQGIRVVTPMPSSVYTPTPLSAPGVEIRTAWCNDGLLAYAAKRRRRQPEPDPVPVTDQVRVRNEWQEEARQRGLEVSVAVGVAGATTMTVAAARKVAWKHFWQAVIRRFALRGAVAAGLSAADGPLPFGELISVGMAAATAIEIIVIWDDLWRQAEGIAAEEA
jgi:hypothetical protein